LAEIDNPAPRLLQCPEDVKSTRLEIVEDPGIGGDDDVVRPLRIGRDAVDEQRLPVPVARDERERFLELEEDVFGDESLPGTRIDLSFGRRPHPQILSTSRHGLDELERLVTLDFVIGPPGMMPLRACGLDLPIGRGEEPLHEMRPVVPAGIIFPEVSEKASNFCCLSIDGHPAALAGLAVRSLTRLVVAAKLFGINGLFCHEAIDSPRGIGGVFGRTIRDKPFGELCRAFGHCRRIPPIDDEKRRFRSGAIAAHHRESRYDCTRWYRRERGGDLESGKNGLPGSRMGVGGIAKLRLADTCGKFKADSKETLRSRRRVGDSRRFA